TPGAGGAGAGGTPGAGGAGAGGTPGAGGAGSGGTPGSGGTQGTGGSGGAASGGDAGAGGEEVDEAPAMLSQTGFYTARGADGELVLAEGVREFEPRYWLW